MFRCAYVKRAVCTHPQKPALPLTSAPAVHKICLGGDAAPPASGNPRGERALPSFFDVDPPKIDCSLPLLIFLFAF